MRWAEILGVASCFGQRERMNFRQRYVLVIFKTENIHAGMHACVGLTTLLAYGNTLEPLGPQHADFQVRSIDLSIPNLP